MFSVPIGSSAAPSRPSRAAAAAALTDPMASTKKKIVAKLVLLGESGVGKTSLVHRFLEGHFVEKEATIGCVFLTKDLAVDGYTVHFDIWDTAGQERYNSLAPLFYRGASAAVVVYDITKEASYFRAKGWVEKLENDGEAKPDIVVALAGNKADLLEARQVRSEEADAYAWLMGLLFTETSARTGYNVDEIFFEIAKKLVNAQPPENQLEGMNLSQDGNKNAANKSSCCY